MLVLSRKLGESIAIDKNIVITVVEIRGDKIRLGIDAPKHIGVHRQEVADAIAAKLTEESNPEASSETAPQATC
jgi:carbon storage regulator